MKITVRFTVLALVLCLALFAQAQPQLNLYAGSFLPSQRASLSYNIPNGVTQFRLERVLNPEAVLPNLPNVQKPVLPANARTSLLRTFTRRSSDSSYGEIVFGRLPNGVYAIKATSGGYQASTLMLVSDLGVIVKRSPTEMLAYAANRVTGQTRAAQLWVLENGVKAKLNSSNDGLARFSSKGLGNPLVLARFGNAWAVSGSYFPSYNVSKLKGYVYTDRPIYRPGQHVDFKGTLRDAKTYRAVANKSVRVTIKDFNDEEVFKTTLETNAAGSFGSGFDLALEPAIGDYSIRAQTLDSDETYYGSFRVEAYVKPEYAVTVTPSKPRAVQGDRVTVTVNAEYLFGGAVSGAKVNYFVTKARYYSYSWGDEFWDGSEETQDYGSDLVIQEEARLDQRGKLEITLPLEKTQDGEPLSYRIQAEVEDESRRTVAGQTRVIAFPAAVDVSAITDSYVYNPGKTVRVQLETKNLEDQGVPASVTLEVLREEWVQKKNQWDLKSTVIQTLSARTNAKGEGLATFQAPRGGGYTIRARVKDGAGRVSSEENFIWVISPGDSWYWNYRELQVKLDQRTYKVGDTATALIGSPKPGAPILVTLEADGIRRAEVVRSAGAAVNYSFKITPDMSPNIFISASMLADENQYEQTATVRVPARDKKLTVTVKPDKAKYQPGETGKLAVQVLDSNGKGVPSEVGLGVVDEAIYLVWPDQTTDIFQFFHARRENAVGTTSSLNFSFESTVVNLATAKPAPSLARPREPLSRAAFAQAKEDAAAAKSGEDVRVRENFKDTIVWLPYLVTDQNGKATVDVTYPDNLTTWRTTARALTGEGKAGQTTAKSLVTKDVLARLTLPQFLVRGDTATLSAIANNTLDKPAKGTMSVELEGLTPVGNARASAKPSVILASNTTSSTLNALQALEFPLTLPAKGRVRSDVVVRAEEAGTATVTATARTDSGSDALKLPLTVLPRGYRDTIAWAEDASQGEHKFTVFNDANPATAKLRVDLTPSLTSAVAPALEYLVGYPYGCTEQTMSRFLPALLARQTLGANALPEAVAKQLPVYQEVGVKRLLDFQHSDGGWGFWTWDNSSLEMSSYVMLGLIRAKSLGSKIKNDVLDRGVKYLIAQAKNDQWTQAERASAYRALAVAGRADVTGMAKLSGRKDLEPYALAQLALAYVDAKRPTEAKDLLDRLKAKRIETERGIHWEKPRNKNDWYYYWDDNQIQVTAAALEALARMERNSPLIPKVSTWLLQNRRGPRWISTQDTASVIQAALTLPKPETATFDADILLNGSSVKTLTGISSTAATQSLELPSDALQPGENVLEVKVTGLGSLVYAAELQLVREPETLRADSSRGLKITRKFDRLESVWDKDNNRYTYTRVPLSRAGKLDPVTVGDLVLVTLEVQSLDRPARYLMVSDPIPAGFKALDERSYAVTGIEQGEDFDSWYYWYSGRELRDERVDLYAYYLEGREVMRYVLRAQTPGTFTALPSRAFLMYDPDVTGVEKAVTLTVRDRGQ